MTSVGDVVFGMEDGTVSIFGLVFGVAFSAHSAKPVVLAGATGAIAAAVSMMAGAYLDISSKRSIAQAQLAHERQEIKDDPKQEAREAEGWLSAAGFDRQEVQSILGVLRKHPGSMLKLQAAVELKIGNTASENPYAHAFWMFLSDLIAAFTPVIPFMLFSLGAARIVSLVVTVVLLLIVGVGRGVVSHRNVVYTALETLGIAAAAAIAGVVIGKLITGGL